LEKNTVNSTQAETVGSAELQCASHNVDHEYNQYISCRTDRVECLAERQQTPLSGIATSSANNMMSLVTNRQQTNNVKETNGAKND